MFKLIRFPVYLVILLLAFSSSCNTFDPPLVVPVYGHIDSIHFTVPADTVRRLGSASAKIPYAWIYLDDNPVGAFQLPCTFPMIASNGIHTVQVYPAIIPVGGTSPASMYPFYQFYSVTINMRQGKTYQINPTSTYFDWVHVAYLLNFDNFSIGGSPTGPGTEIVNYHGDGNASAASTTTMVVVGGKEAFQGNSGRVVVNRTHPYYIGVTEPFDTLNFNNNTNTPVYVELNYKASTEFTIGMFELDTNTQSSPIAIIYPTKAWSKMYVNLNNTIYPSFQAGEQNIYFTIGLDSVDGHTSDTLFLDNIKILD